VKGKGLTIRGNLSKIWPRKYAHLVEFGAKPHKIGNRQHPGSPPSGFMRKAKDTKGGAAIAAFTAQMKEETAKAAASARAKKGR
jgi:hypothetical protein